MTDTSMFGGVESTPGRPEAGARNRALFDMMSTILQQAGLGELFAIDATGQPAGWLWEQITKGIDSQAALEFSFEQTPQYQARFPAIAQLREAQRRGERVGYIPTPRDVIQYEQAVSSMIRQAGLPDWFYSDRNMIQDLMVNDLSPAEIEERLGEAWTMVRNTDPAISGAFSEFFGVEGDAALAAMFLDPTRTQESLNRAARTAYTAGMGRTMGLDIGRQQAERIAGLPQTQAGIAEGLRQVSQLNTRGGVFTEGITEQQNLTAEGTGIEAGILGSGQAQQDIERRLARRQTAARPPGGGAAVTTTGVVGLSNV